MLVNVVIIILTVFFIRNGIDNLKGNIDSVHWYNRRRITEETRPKYGKLIGISTLICAGSVILCAILDLVYGELPEIGGWIVLIAIAVSIVIMIYAQFKYNKGIF